MPVFDAESSRRTTPMHVRLYCFPHAGGTGKLFRSWQDQLQPGIEVCAVEYSGHGTRINEPLLDTIGQLAQSTVEEIGRCRSGSFALLGHSMGSLVAFETCHLLAERRLPMPSLLIVCGHRAPRVPRLSAATHDAPDAEFLTHLRELGATPPEVFGTPDLLELMLPILRSDFRACETYQPPNRPRLSVPIAAYGGLRDKETSKEALLAWGEQTTGRCTVRMFPGDHFFIGDSAGNVVLPLKRDLLEAVAAEQHSH
ncbi:thioesterase II family protein [Bradyrhizobium sp. HKCCYLS1011]|uniref:thioesterase II family protein n=1 Tax=Bradyrhizobium sp. HKCCYLS1011 TaxID=3420733 RepID=UPI003EC037DD